MTKKKAGMTPRENDNTNTVPDYKSATGYGEQLFYAKMSHKQLVFH
jgi:hypothetical protein